MTSLFLVFALVASFMYATKHNRSHIAKTFSLLILTAALAPNTICVNALLDPNVPVLDLRDTVPTDPSPKSRGSTLFIGIVILLQSLFVTNYFYVKSLRCQRDNEPEPIRSLVSSEQMEKATNALNDTWLLF